MRELNRWTISDRREFTDVSGAKHYICTMIPRKKIDAYRYKCVTAIFDNGQKRNLIHSAQTISHAGKLFNELSIKYNVLYMNVWHKQSNQQVTSYSKNRLPRFRK